MEKIQFEMIVCIANAGFSGEVMEAERAEGAMGGTVIHARGTGRKKAEKTFQITINTEKDLVIIIVKSEIKDNVMKAIYKEVGLGTDANCVAFLLPVTDDIGIK